MHPLTNRPRRAMRVGVLLGGHLVEERIFAGEVPVRIGQSLRCDLSIPVEALPQEHVLFAFDQGQRRLRITAAMTGRLAQGSTIRTQLREGASDGGVWTLPLEKGVRGRIEVGEATILFQEVALAPVAPRPQLPASIRGTFADRVDRRLATIVGMSLMAHVAIGTWASLVDREIADEQDEQIAQEYQHRTIIENPVFPDVPSTPSTTPATTPSTPSQPSQPAVAPVPSTQHPTTVGKRPRPNVPTTLPETDPALLAQMMTSGTGPNGQPGGMNPRKPQTDLQKEIDDAKLREGVGNEEGGFRKDREPQIGPGPGPIVKDPMDIIQTPDKDERPVRIHPVPVPPGPGPEPTLTADAIVSKIKNHYMSGLQRCYRKGLATDATLRGTLKLTFTVDETGRVTDGEATGLTSQVSSCVEEYMESWRFAAPKNRTTGEPTSAPFKLSLAMQPS